MPNVRIPGVGNVRFPDTMTGEEISAAAKSIHDRKHGMGTGTPNLTGEPMFPNLLALKDRTRMGSALASDRPADTDPASLATAAANQPPGPGAPAPSDWRDTALDVGVGAGSTVAGLAGALGGPLTAIGAAGLGGANLSMLADMAREGMGTPRAPHTFGQAAANAAVTGATSAAAQGVGEGLNMLRVAEAPRMARAAFPKNMSAGYVRDFGETMPEPWTEVLNDRSLPVPSVGGKAAMNARVRLAADAQRSIEGQAGTYDATQFLSGIDSRIAELTRVGDAQSVAELEHFREQFVRGMNPAPQASGLLGANGQPIPAPPQVPQEWTGADVAHMGRYRAQLGKAALQNPNVGAARLAASPNEGMANSAVGLDVSGVLKRDLAGAMAPDPFGTGDIVGLEAARRITQREMALRSALGEAWRGRPGPVSPWIKLGGLGAAGVTAARGHIPAAIGEAALPWLYEAGRAPAVQMGVARALATPQAEMVARATPQLIGGTAAGRMARSAASRRKPGLAQKAFSGQ